LKAAFLTGIEKMEIREVPSPGPPDAGEVLLAVNSVGVCGSDMHYYRTGRIGDQVVTFPFILGHELSATVIDAGAEAGKLAAGDRVAIDPLVYCGKCDQCLMGREHTCRDQVFMGVPGQLAGALAERIVMPARCCHRIPKTMTDEQAALVEPFSIGLYARLLAGDVAGKTVAILGCGPIGLSVLMALRQAEAGEVYVTDLLDYRGELATTLGANWTGNPDGEDIVAAVRSRHPEGVDVVFECAGRQETADQCVQLLTPGGLMVLVGIPPLDRLSFDMNYMRRSELRVQNVRRQNKCVRRAIELIDSGQVEAGRMITHHFTLDETAEAFDIVSNYKDNVVKAMIRVA